VKVLKEEGEGEDRSQSMSGFYKQKQRKRNRAHNTDYFLSFLLFIAYKSKLLFSKPKANVQRLGGTLPHRPNQN